MNDVRFSALKFLSSLPLIGIFPWFLFIVFGVMLFDAPGSMENPRTWLLFFSCLLYPAISVYGFRFTSNAVYEESFDRAFWGLLLSYLAPTLVYLSHLALDIFCDGKYAC